MMRLPPATLAEPQASLSATEFAEAMAGLGPWEERLHLAVAVSGGSDSLALSLLADDWARGRGATLLCFIVDHRLRAESTTEAHQVRCWLESLGLHAEILSSDHASMTSDHGSIQERARRLRYRLLINECIARRIPHLLLAHHRDDQAETVLMRMVRGSGLRGLASMTTAALAPGSAGRVRLLRPLLHVPKMRLRAILQAVGPGSKILQIPIHAMSACAGASSCHCWKQEGSIPLASPTVRHDLLKNGPRWTAPALLGWRKRLRLLVSGMWSSRPRNIPLSTPSLPRRRSGASSVP
jgi:tRNA(Ile)-lysidine synthetase-like protein